MFFPHYSCGHLYLFHQTTIKWWQEVEVNNGLQVHDSMYWRKHSKIKLSKILHSFKGNNREFRGITVLVSSSEPVQTANCTRIRQINPRAQMGHLQKRVKLMRMRKLQPPVRCRALVVMSSTCYYFIFLHFLHAKLFKICNMNKWI